MKLKYRILPLSAILCLTVLLSQTQAIDSTRENVSTWGGIMYDSPTSLSLGRMMYQNWKFSAQVRTATTDLWIGHYDSLSQVQVARQIRPDFVALLYRNTRSTWKAGHPEYNATEYQLFSNNGWFLRDIYGAVVTGESGHSIMVDVGNPNYQQWLANWLKFYVDKYALNGVELDNCAPSREIWWEVSGNPINPRTGTTWTNDEVKDAIIAMINKVKDTLGPTKYVLANGIYRGTRFYDQSQQPRYLAYLNSKLDGLMSEGWISSTSLAEWYDESGWLDSINFAVWLQDNFVAKKPQAIFLVICENAAVSQDDGTYVANLPPGVTQEQYVTYAFASLLLAANTRGNYIEFGYYMPEPYPQSLFNINLGNPLGPYYMVSGTHVYSRDFSSVKVLVNPTSDSYSVTLNGNYETVDGTSVTSPITVSAHTGVILRRL